jgi:hypothetical protein
MPVDLIFRQPSGGPLSPPIALVFGSNLTPTNATAVLDVTLPAPVVSIQASRLIPATLEIALPGPVVLFTGLFDINVTRPTTGQAGSAWQNAAARVAGVQDRSQDNARLLLGTQDRASSASPRRAGVEVLLANLFRAERVGVREGHTEAQRLPIAQVEQSMRSRPRVRTSLASRAQSAQARRQSVETRFQDRTRRRISLSQGIDAAQSLRHSVGQGMRDGLSIRLGYSAIYQEAIVPPPGLSDTSPPPPPPPEPCYITPAGDAANLIFLRSPASDNSLIFICETHGDNVPATVIVPIRRVYFVLNNVLLRRVEGNLLLPALNSLTMSIDTDSWTWSFSASLPGSSLPDIEPGNDGLPVELEANINGNLYRVLAENISRERTFNSSTIRVSGRGKTAYLASPYAPVMTFSNSTARTAQQLMADVLTFNNVPLGWDIDWQIEDWLVPAGAFGAQGSYIDALNSIVAAAGGYLQPHPVDQEISALLRYPVAPWQWGTVTPDFELPSAVTVRESIEWRNKPEYNRVFVSATSQGVLAQVTRQGTAGDLLAPMVTDPLISTAVPGRLRGISVLADTGRQAAVSLRLPVLPETGIITPGKFVRYTDGSDIRLGIVRGTTVDVAMPDVWQTLNVETHE